ncbi:MAG: J domain-containing protein [Blastocatellia bacterium]|nr:J domain-containing protein [Blastocatellia bacterium]
MNLHSVDDPYKTLQVERGASEAVVKQAYFALIREHSPETDPEGFKRIRAAYERLRAGRERAETDLLLFDDRAADLAPENLARAPLPAQRLAPDLLRDLLAIEALVLLEELYDAPRGPR